MNLRLLIGATSTLLVVLGSLISPVHGRMMDWIFGRKDTSSPDENQVEGRHQTRHSIRHNPLFSPPLPIPMPFHGSHESNGRLHGHPPHSFTHFGPAALRGSQAKPTESSGNLAGDWFHPLPHGKEEDHHRHHGKHPGHHHHTGKHHHDRPDRHHHYHHGSTLPKSSSGSSVSSSSSTRSAPAQSLDVQVDRD